MKAIVDEGRVVGLVTGDVDGIAVPPALQGTSLADLALLDGELVDIQTLGERTFYVDAVGVKHLDDADGRQTLLCFGLDRLIQDVDGNWRVETDDDRLNAARADAVQRVRTYAEEKRLLIAGAAGAAKLAVYAQRASYARAIKAGNGTDAMEAVAKSEAVRIGKVASLDDANAATVTAMADLWIKLDEKLAGHSAEMDALETGIIAQVNAAAIDDIEPVLSTALVAAETRVAQVLSGA